MRHLAILHGAILLVWVSCVDAHKPSDSYLRLGTSTGSAVVVGQWDIALRDLDHSLGLDDNQDGAITWGELKAHREALTGYVLRRLDIESLSARSRGHCASYPGALLFDEHVDGGYAVLRFTARCPFIPSRLEVNYDLFFDLDPNHRGLLDVRVGATSHALVLAADERNVTIDLGSPNRPGQFRSFLEEGIWHIWTGYDHILFLLSLLLPAVLVYAHGSWSPRSSMRAALLDVLKIVTAFTLAHSLTLSLAANGWVDLPSRWVESAIALTVLLGALNNLHPVVRERRWVVAFAFGLVHGLGFASVLSDLGLYRWDLAIALVGFNSGVEVGQLAIVATVVPIMYVMRGTPFYRRAFMPAGAAVIGSIAVYWLAIRITGSNLQ
jgi:HupE / UreJ protein